MIITKKSWNKNLFFEYSFQKGGFPMERVLSPDEKIRRAEELYFRRAQGSNTINRVATVNVDNKKKKSYIRKMCIQCIVCITIYAAFYAVKNREDILPKNVVEKINEILQYDIDIQALQGKINRYVIEVNEKITKNNPEEIKPPSEDLPEATLAATDSKEENETEKDKREEQEEETKKTEEPTVIEEASSIDKMKEDAEYIKKNYSFIKPLEGQITSRFGLRENVNPKYHTGIDIAEDQGTVIVAAMEGTVELVSGEGNYGNHFKITNGEISTLYAHCKTIYIKEGEHITQGQQVAEVGETGNATGPHLHFEILRNGELVNPDLVLQF